MSPVNPLHILVIEDDLDTRANLRDILEMDDHRVEVAGSAAEALARDDWSSFSTILLDRKLPDANADQLLPRLKLAAPDAAFIVVTGYADLQGAVSAMRQGATDYILKPIDADDLRARLGRIAEAHQIGSELKRQAEIVRSLLANASDAIIVVDRNGKILLHNPAATRLIGPMTNGAFPEGWRQREQAGCGESSSGHVTRDQPLARVLRCDQIVDEEIFIRPPDHEAGRWMSVNASPIYNEKGTEGAVIIYRDISERKRAEEELRRQRDLAEGLIASAPAVVVVLDHDGRIIRFNQFAEQLSGYSAEEVLGRDWFTTLVPDRDRARIGEVFRSLLGDMETSGVVNSILTRDGREREVRWSNRVLRDAEGTVQGILAIGEDITDLIEAQERAVRVERLAAIGEMVAGLAHESRNALQRSQACLEMLAVQVEDRPVALNLIARLQDAQDHLHHLYEDVRGYAAPIRLERAEANLADVWREAWAHLETARKGREATIHEEDGGLDLMCDVDPFRLGRVFGNIMENALAACVDPVEIWIACTTAELNGRPAIRVGVRDNGPGLTPEARRRIFEPFFTTKTKGTGLGMAISLRIVEAHGGRMGVGDGEGPGTEIMITLPREKL